MNAEDEKHIFSNTVGGHETLFLHKQFLPLLKWLHFCLCPNDFENWDHRYFIVCVSYILNVRAMLDINKW